MNKKWSMLVGLVILLVAIPLTMYLVRQQQIIRSRAIGEQPVTFRFDPATASRPAGEEFDARVILEAGNYDVAGVQVSAISSDQNKLQILRFTPSSEYIRVGNPVVTPSRFRYVGVNQQRDRRTGDVVVGTVRVRLLAAATTPVQLQFDDTNTRVVVSRATGFTSSTANVGGSYSLPAASPSPTPTLAPGQPFITDISFHPDLPACFSSPLTAEQLGRITIHWQGQAFSDRFWVDISENENFSGTNFLHRDVVATAGRTQYTADLIGFNHLITTGPAGRFAPVPGRTYFVRVFNGPANPAGTPTGTGIHSPVRSFSTTLCPSPSPTPTPALLTCSDVVPTGLTDTGGRGGAGEKIFQVSSDGANVRLNITRTPTTATINQPSSTRTAGVGNIAFSPETGGTGNWIANIAANTSTSVDNVYRVETNVGPTGQTTSCPATIIRVQRAPAVVACRYQETKVFVRGTGDTAWVRNRRLSVGQQFRVAAFHDEGQFSDNFANDIRILVTDPDNQQFAINNVDNTDTLDDNNVAFTPTRPGRYVFSASTRGMERTAGCIDSSAVVDVAPLTAVTTHFKVAESRGGLDSAPDIPYTVHPLTFSYSFINRTLGEKQIWVKFFGTDTSGQPTDRIEGPFNITIVNPDPQITGVDCDLNLEGGVRFTINGTNFGAAQGRRGAVRSGQTALRIDSWSDTRVAASLNQTATTGQAFPTILTRDDQVASDEATCSIDTSQIQAGANLFCRQPSTRAASDVELIVAEARDGGTVARETVTIDSRGLIAGLRTRLQEGRPYRISVKAPKSLRRVVEVRSASRGTTRLGNLNLPVGDIFPADGDGRINSADFGQLIREWVVAAAATGERRADLNGDSRINSFDWACMRPDFNKSDDPEPEARPIEGLAAPSPTPRPAPVATGSATVSTPSATVSTGSGTVSP